MQYVVSVPSRFSLDQQAQWWKPLAPVVDGLVLSTIFIRGTVVQLVDLPDAIVPTFHQKAFDELFGQWLPEQLQMNWQDEWTLTWLLVPKGQTQQRLEDALSEHVSTAILRSYWFKGWKHAVTLSFPQEQTAELLPVVLAAGWKRLPIPSPLLSPTSAGSIARVVAKPTSYLPYMSSGAMTSAVAVLSAVQEQRPDSPLSATTQAVGAGSTVGAAGHDGVSPLLAADDRLAINLGVTPIGDSVRVARTPLRMHVYAGEHAALLSFIVMMLDRSLLGDEDRATPVVGILPPSCRDLQGVAALQQRIRFLDPNDLYRSSAIPLNFLAPERRNAVFARHGVQLGGATVPATTELADFLRDHGAAHLCTAPILAFTAPQPPDEEQDELIAVLKQGGGIILLGEDTWETRLLSDLLWALVEQEVVPAGMPLCVLTHAGICPPASLEQHVVHVQFNPPRSLQGQAHIEVRSNPDHWILRDFTGERRVLDGDLYASSTDQTHAVVEQLVAAFGDMSVPIRRVSPYAEGAMVAALDQAVAGLEDFGPDERALHGYSSAQPTSAPAPAAVVGQDDDSLARGVALGGAPGPQGHSEERGMGVGVGENGGSMPRQADSGDHGVVQKHGILAHPHARKSAGHMELRYALEAAHHQSTSAADLLRSAVEGRQPSDWTRYWWEALLLGAGHDAAARLSEEVAMRQTIHPLAYRLLMESQLMSDPVAVADYSLMVMSQAAPEALAPAAERVVEESASVATVPKAMEPAAAPPKKRRSLVAFTG